jgi:SAM-dependent methyltransferase
MRSTVPAVNTFQAARPGDVALPASQRRRAENELLLQEIAGFCRGVGMAESTFGRRAVNDGKFVARLRFGGRVTTHTVERVRLFIARHGSETARTRSGSAQASVPMPGLFGPLLDVARTGVEGRSAKAGAPVPSAPAIAPSFRFYDNRQKYLLFVNTCAEKWVVAQRIELELALIRPHPPAMRVFDAGVGDGTVLARVLRSMHDRMPTVPFYVVGKEISLEDVRLALEKMPDRFCEHPATVLVMTNMYYSEAPWLRPKSLAAASGLEWHELALKGSTAGQFDRQITELQPFLAEKWTARTSPTSGGLAYDRPVVLVIYREDHKLLLDAVRPRQGAVRADFDLVIASQPYRARAPVEFKAGKVIAPLARALGPGGRLVGFHSYGHDAGLEIIQRIWPEESPFTTDRHQLLKATKQALGADARGLNFNTYADKRSIYSYQMHTLPSEISSSSIGTSTLMAAWNAAVYVAQIDDERLAAVMGNPGYLEATREVLQKHGKLWFLNESFVIWRNRFER